MKTKTTKHKIETLFGKSGYDLWRVNTEVRGALSDPVYDVTLSPWVLLWDALKEAIDD